MHQSLTAIRIPGSGTIVSHILRSSGNTSDATWWTDGRCVSPDGPEASLLRIQRPTDEFFWPDEREEPGPCPELDGLTWRQLDAMIGSADDPEIADLERALALGSTPEKLRYLRIQLWWKHNDTVRDSGELQADPAAYHENAQALIRLTDPDNPNQRLMAAEAARNIGDFDQSLSLLEKAFPESHAKAAAQIRELATQRDRIVRQLRF